MRKLGKKFGFFVVLVVNIVSRDVDFETAQYSRSTDL
jgi:hypothetical protein